MPLLQGYGMTEAAPGVLMAVPGKASRRPLSPGVPHFFTDVALRDTSGEIGLAQGTRERLVRGPNVFRGYWNRSADTEASFTDGWFRTGDQGFLDPDGYLTLVGRLKELINRGGEKISPREIDEVLLAHPSVAEAVCFGVPHATWGEEVEAVVVVRDPVTASDLLAFCRERLADYKRPKQIHITDAIPRTATGKIQRGVVARAFSQKPA